MRIRNIAVLGVVIAIALALGAGGASARKHSARKAVSSTAILDSVNADGFTGHISATKGACRDQRQVTIYMVNTDSSVPSSVPFGTAVTRNDGSWSLGGWAYPGEYYAVAAIRKTPKFLCGDATSSSKTWWTSPGSSR